MMPRSSKRIPGGKRGAPGCGVLLLLLIGVMCSRLMPAPARAPAQATRTPAPAAAVLQPTQPAVVRMAAPAAVQAVAEAVDISEADAAITVAGWNVGLDDADVGTISARIGALDGVDLWGLAEVNSPAAVDDLQAAAAVGEPGDFAAVMGSSGDAMRLVAIYDKTRFDLLEWYEVDEINTTGNVRAPLVLHLRDKLGGEQLLFMVNHLYRSRDAERHKQAQLLADWAANKTLPVIAVGDYNFDWEVTGGEQNHDQGFDLMTAGGAWEWIRPPALTTTQCSGWPCRYNSVLDFVFAAGPAQGWRAESEILVAPGDFPDDTAKSDHRPVLARFVPQEMGSPVAADTSAQPEGAPTEDKPIAQPTDAPIAAVAPLVLATGPTVNGGANLRGGPGTSYPVVGGATEGQTVEVVGRSDAGDWLKLADGTWIAAFLVDGVPPGLGIAEAPLSPAAPVVEERANVAAAPVEEPTATPPPPAPPPVVRQQSDCDPSYPSVCIPSPPPDLNCGNIPYRRFSVVGSDPHHFDGDHDGVGCESG